MSPAATCPCSLKSDTELYDDCFCGVCGHKSEKDEDGCPCGADNWVQRADVCDSDLHDYVWAAFVTLAKLAAKKKKLNLSGETIRLDRRIYVAEHSHRNGTSLFHFVFVPKAKDDFPDRQTVIDTCGIEYDAQDGSDERLDIWCCGGFDIPVIRVGETAHAAH
jgi:hypothetical protein